MDADEEAAGLVPAFDFKFNREQLSSEEFHRKLYEWFEDRGLLSDLRSHLRTKMISVLKETPIGRSDSKKSMSPKVQAMNLLLAEFLIQQNCFYSLSVFSTEVPLANILPELNNNFMNKPDAGWKFEEKDALDILETLSFQRDNETVSGILKTYFSAENKEALLSCVLKTLPKTINAERTLPALTTLQTEGHEITYDDIADILKNSKLPMLSAEKIMQKLTQARDFIIKQQKEKYEKLTQEANECKEQAQVALLKAQTEGLTMSEDLKRQKELWESKNRTLQQQQEELYKMQMDLKKKDEELNEMKAHYERLRAECESKLAQSASEAEALRKIIEMLREENARLESVNGEHRRKAEKFRMNARLLTSELSAARHQRRSYAANARTKNVSFSGEGEQVTDLSAPLLFPQTHHVMGRRHNGCCLSSSDETQHIDVLEETRGRLQRLQQENDRIDRKINFSLNQQKKYLQPTSSSDSEAACGSKNVFSFDVNDIKLRSFEEKEKDLKDSTGASSEPPNLNLSLSSDLQLAESDDSTDDDHKLED